MRNISIKSLTNSYVSIRNFLLKPYSEGILNDSGLIRSEYKSLKNLADMHKIQLSNEDYTYIVSKLVTTDSGNGGNVNTYSREEVNSLLEQKLNINGTAVSAYLLTPGSVLNLTGGVSGSGLIDGNNISINTTVDLSSVLKNDDLRISNWDLASTNTHTHSNKTVIDSTTASYTIALNNKLNGIAVGANNYVHPTSGVVGGSYTKVTVDNNGHITSGTNPSTLAGYTITDAYNKTEIDSKLGDIDSLLTAILGE